MANDKSLKLMTHSVGNNNQVYSWLRRPGEDNISMSHCMNFRDSLHSRWVCGETRESWPSLACMGLMTHTITHMVGREKSSWLIILTYWLSVTQVTQWLTMWEILFFMRESSHQVRMAGGLEPLASHTTWWGIPAETGPSRPRTSTLSGPTVGRGRKRIFTEGASVGILAESGIMQR